MSIHTYGGYFMEAPGAYNKAATRDATGAEHRHRTLLLRRRGHDLLAPARSTATRSSRPSGPARSPTCSTAQRATRPTISTTARASSTTASKPGHASRQSIERTGAITRTAPTSRAASSRASAPPFESKGRPRGVRVHRRQLRPPRGALAYWRRPDATDRRASTRTTSPRPTDPPLDCRFSLAGRGGGDPLHDQRLNADAQLADL